MNKMLKKFEIISLVLLTFIIVLSANFISAADLCWIESGSSPSSAVANCNANQINGVNGNAIMYLSGTTNAHGELLSQANYNNVLCCAVASGSSSCTGDNKVIGLSSITNAHAERPENTAYTNNVCYGSLLNCYNGPADTQETSVITLSAITNAHLGTGYTTQISCKYSLPPTTCTLTSATWEITEKTEGNSVKMIVDGTESCGTSTSQVSFEVLQGSTVIATPVNAQFASGATQVNGTWTNIGPAGTYTFRATVVGSSPVESEDSGNSLLVNAIPPWCTDGVIPDPLICQDYDTQSRCDDNECGLSQQQIENSWGANPPVNCGAPGISCSCWWNVTTSSCGPAYTVDLDPNPPCGNNIIEVYSDGTQEVCDGTQLALSSNSCTAFDQYVGGTVSCRSDCLGYNFSLCTPSPVCGNGALETPTEECDDGNFVDGDGCSIFCQIEPGHTPSCENNIIEVYSDGTQEVCDGTQLALSSNSCTAFDEYTGGTVSCRSDCLGYNFSLCTPSPVCGNGALETPTEECDDGNFVDGDGCSSSCQSEPFDCGNGVRESTEVCDEPDLDGYSCSSFGLSGNNLACNSQCDGFITSGCTGYSCNNDGIRDDGSESCDGSQHGGFECTDFDDFTGGPLSCDDSCEFDTSQCTKPVSKGTCYYTADTTDTCEDDSFLTVTWYTRWEGPIGGTLYEQCRGDNGDEDSIACPAQIPLPFFTFWNLVAAVAIIAVIYVSMHARKGRRKR